MTRNGTALGIAILMACWGGCYDDGKSIGEDEWGGGAGVFAADTPKVYFQSGPTIDLTYSMNSDGTGKAALPSGVYGEPSVALHGGNRWFLRREPIANETYPDGQPRREIFAIRGDGDTAFTVQLTTQADLQVMPLNRWTGGQDLRWKAGDTGISWIARRWSGGVVVEGGVYSAEIVFDANGDVTGLAVQPSIPDFAPGLTSSGQPNMVHFDWSPDGTQLVYEGWQPSQIRIGNLLGSSQLLVQFSGGAGAHDPRWSPDGSKIAYVDDNSKIYTISPNGSGKKAATSPGNKFDGSPIWSPTGTQLIFRRSTSLVAGSGVVDIFRVTLGSTNATNLTSDFAGGAFPFGWR